MTQTEQQVDVVVIGMGPGGEEVAGRLAEAGLSVVGVERELVGGECPYWGCVPSKMIIRGANLLAETRRIDKVSGKATVEPDLGIVARRIRDEATDNWDDKVAADRFDGKGGRLVRGDAKLDGPGRVSRRRRRLHGQPRRRTRHWFCPRRAAARTVSPRPATGPTARPSRPPPPPSRSPCSVPARSGWSSRRRSRASARQVTVIEAMDRVLPPEEPEASEVIGRVLRAEGIELWLGLRATRVEREDDHVNARGSTTARRYARPSCS